MQTERIADRARGRWKGILAGLGLDSRHLNGKHGPCPMCGGKDRFRFDDKGGNGTFYCSHCGAGDGVALVMKVKGVMFIDAKQAIEGLIGAAPVVVPKAGRSDDEQRDQMAALWRRASPLDGQDIASRYLERRGIAGPVPPLCLRWLDDIPYFDDETKVRTLRPAMLAKFVAPDGKSAMLHRTYLAEPGVKADVAKPKMMMPGKVPTGGAVRIGAAAETMGVAEGIETALASAKLAGVPVWSALTAGGMIKWAPPAEAKSIIIFGDRDASFAGQNAAFALAYRIKSEGRNVEVRFPDPEEGKDFCDVLQGRNGIDA
jgi:putative DNA primase/helicase